MTCVFRLKNYSNPLILKMFDTEKQLINCKYENIKESFQEIFKRFISPFYLPVLSLIACLIIIKSKDDYKYNKYKFGLFFLGVSAIIISEISIKYSSINVFQNIYLVSLPALFFLSIYLYFKIKLKKPNLINP